MKEKMEMMDDLYIDCHTHFGIMISSLFDDKMPYCQNMIGILENLNISPINACITFPFPNSFIGCDVLADREQNESIRNIFEKIPYKIQNERLILEAEQIARGKVLPMLMFSLKFSVDEQLEYLTNVAKEKYLYGLKYYPEADNLSFAKFDEYGNRFIEFMLKYDLPLVVHSSACTVSDKKGLSYPGDIVNLALKYPKLRICIAHMAHFSKDVFDNLKLCELPNLFFDTSPFLHLCMISNNLSSGDWLDLDYRKPQFVLEYMIKCFSSHILWGSDFPFNYTCNLNNKFHDKDYMHYSYENNMQLLNTLDKNAIKLITHDNVIRFLYGI